MKNIVVVGSQWGDEGKGKIVDWLSEQAATSHSCNILCVKTKSITPLSSLFLSTIAHAL